MRIYKIVNTINNKIYVGQTTKPLSQRFSGHCSYSKNRYSAISAAIKKYGSNNFSIHLIEECISAEHLNEREIYWIKELNTIAPNGYNLDSGGKGVGKTGYKHTDEMKEKMRNFFKGKKMSEEFCEKVRERMMGNTYLRGKKFSDQEKAAVRKIVSEYKPRGNNGYKGVSWNNKTKMYVSKLKIGDKHYNNGNFIESKNGAIAYDISIKLYRNNEGYLNFPDKDIFELIDEIEEEPHKSLNKLIAEIKPNKEYKHSLSKRSHERRVNKIVKPRTPNGFKGVTYNKESKNFLTTFRYNSENIYCGRYNLSENGGISYDILAHIKRPGIGYFNFPEKTLEELIKLLSEDPSNIMREIVNNYFGEEIFKDNSDKRVEEVYLSKFNEKPKSKSGYKGVCCDRGRYFAKFKFKDFSINTNYYKIPINSAITYDIIAHIKRPNIGYFNFPGKNIDELLLELTESLCKKTKQLIEEYKSGT